MTPVSSVAVRAGEQVTMRVGSCTPRLHAESDPSLGTRWWEPQKDMSWGGTRQSACPSGR